MFAFRILQDKIDEPYLNRNYETVTSLPSSIEELSLISDEGDWLIRTGAAAHA